MSLAEVGLVSEGALVRMGRLGSPVAGLGLLAGLGSPVAGLGLLAGASGGSGAAVDGS